MRVLLWILEDDQALGLLLKTILSGLVPPIQLRIFTTGEEALRAKGVPDIMFADTHLAGRLTGPEVVESLRARHPDIAVVFSSSLGGPPDSVLWPRDRVLPKPFSIAAIRSQVQQMIAEIPRLQALPHPRQHHQLHPRAFKRA